eukprot:TRINITY_DN7610_c4_g1_i1.p1 TRINITY_DN7610_c4_g1~~TRINITY_DN7610_c4_g1_i1.p1  ORF type:complete len:645 (+),score=109.54 TRINITY_DN7610_c4_g1_i1:169-1935(+)
MSPAGNEVMFDPFPVPAEDVDNAEPELPTLLPQRRLEMPGSPFSPGHRVEVKRTFIEVTPPRAEQVADASADLAMRRTKTCPDEQQFFDDQDAWDDSAGGQEVHSRSEKKRVTFHVPEDSADGATIVAEGCSALTRSSRRQCYGTEDLREALLESGQEQYYFDSLGTQQDDRARGGVPAGRWGTPTKPQEDVSAKPQLPVRRRWNRGERRNVYNTEDLREELLESQCEGTLCNPSELFSESVGSPNFLQQRNEAFRPSTMNDGPFVNAHEVAPLPSTVPLPLPFCRGSGQDGSPGGALSSALQTALEWQYAAAAAAAAKSVAEARAQDAARAYHYAARTCSSPASRFENEQNFCPSPATYAGGQGRWANAVDFSPSSNELRATKKTEFSPVSKSNLQNSPLADSSASEERPRNKRPLRLWIHIHLHMKRPGFDLVPMLIGRGGQNVRKIADRTGAKIRVRGRGSGHKEINGKFEAPTPLMVAVTTELKDAAGFRMAVQMTLDELRQVERRFYEFMEKTSEGERFTGPCYSLGLLNDGAEELLRGVIDGIPLAETKTSSSKSSGGRGNFSRNGMSRDAHDDERVYTASL